MSTYDFDNTIKQPIEKVWEALHKPADIISEWNAKIEKTSETQWKELTDSDMYNALTATFDDDNYLLNIVGINSQYASEENDIHIKLEAIDENTTKVSVHYEVKTGAILNKISLKLFGEKLAHHADNVIMKNIKKAIG